MKLPKAFIPEKDLSNQVNQLIEERQYNSANVDRIMDCYDEFLEKKNISRYISMLYDLGKSIVENIDYEKDDLFEFVKRIQKDDYSGLYVSALVNKLAEHENEIILNTDIEMSHIGAYLKEGHLIVVGDLGDLTGWEMLNGRITVHGNTGALTGSFMADGIISVYGKVMSLDFLNCKGKIYENDEQIWPSVQSLT